MLGTLQLRRQRWVYDTAPEGKAVRVELYYSKGGLNVWNGKKEERGIWLLIHPVELEEGCVRQRLTGPRQQTGVRIFVKALARWIPKRLEEVVNAIGDKVAVIAPSWDEGWEAAASGLTRVINEYTGRVAV